MARKKKAATNGEPVKNTGTRVIALKEFEGHRYGAEFQMPKGAKLDKAIADGKVRIDDRMPGERIAPEAPADVAATEPPAE